MEPRLYVRDRTDRRLDGINKFLGDNQRKNLGRRTPERKAFYIYKASVSVLTVTLAFNVSFITYCLATF